MTELEQRILDIIQDGFPIVERPYAAIAEIFAHRYGHTVAEKVHEQKVYETVESLRESGVIRRIGGVYNTKRLGLVSRLCAGKVPSVATGAADDSALVQFAEEVMNVAAITHNYVRSHEYNVWFTVIAESNEKLQAIIDQLTSKTALHDVHSMPAKKMFKINTVMTRDHRNLDAIPDVAPEKPATDLTDGDRARIRLLSGNIPRGLTPFADMGINLDEARSDLEEKRMRRFGAVLRHQQAGFPCNAMVCFNVVDASAAGTILAAYPHVSHCYERPPFEGFDFNVYGMFHAQSEMELNTLVGEAVKVLGNPKYAVLYSLRELKKTSYKYFAE